METGQKYIIKHESGISIMQVIFETSHCFKIRWDNGIEEWIYKSDFKSIHSYIDPKKIVLHKIPIEPCSS